MKWNTGIVVIGRNEGERLKACLRSLEAAGSPVVYVDSGSTDRSPAFALSMGVSVVDLDMSVPFTAARSRNAGAAHLFELHPEISFIQFIDGDCVMAPGWLETAAAHLSTTPQLAAVAGVLREANPNASIYNRLCEREWTAVAGDSKTFGGIVMIRADAFRAVGGFESGLIAGEEPDLAVRLRELGYTLRRIEVHMATHDAAMFHFRQWWKRSVRAGYAFAEIAWRHRQSPAAIWKTEVVRALIWGLALPLAIVSLAALASPWFLLGFLLYPLQVSRVARRERGDLRWTYSWFMLLAKFAETVGILRFAANRLLRRNGRIIEYKAPLRPTETGRLP